MPGSPKGQKGKKLSKAEKERLKKEEDERKLKEEEELRLKAEKEEQDRKEQEKNEAEEKRRLENEERKRRTGQLQELEMIWENNRNVLISEHAERRKKAKWDRYMKCDGSPDPTIPGEINTYMHLWREDKENNTIEEVLKESKLTLRLAGELAFLIEDTPAEELPEASIPKYKGTIAELETLLQEKLEFASHDLLMKAKSLADSETMNLQKVISNDVITLATWGNLSKNLRIKQFEFEEKGFMFEIPKVLCLSDCAIRVLFTAYDHLSPQSRTYHPRQKRKVEEVPEDEAKEEEEKKEGEEEEGEKKEGEEGEELGLEREESEDVMAALRELEEERAKPEEEEQEEGKPEEEEGMEEDYEIKTPEPVEWEDFDGDDDAIDLRAYHIMGGIFHFNLLHMPPQPKIVRDWVIVQVEDPPELNYMEYVADGVAPPSSAKPKDEEKDKDQGEEEGKKREERPPITVTIKLPENVYFCEEPQVVRWKDEQKEWRLEGFTDHAFNEENRILTFKTMYFGTMALVQDAHINMPFQSWELRPHSANSAVFTIIAAIIEVEIEIQEGMCSLNVPDERKELAHLRDKWFPPKEFIERMRAAGMNIFPAIDSSKYVSIQNKNAVTEDRLYQQMALTASSMAYSWSKWNSDIKDDSKVVIQGTEHLEDEPLLEEDWSLFLVTKKRVTKLKMTEFDEKFSEDHAEGTEFHADLYHMAMELISEKGRDRINDTDYQFIDCIYQLLSATRIITYS